MIHPSLYPFQKDGVGWLVDNGHGFLWDDPGLGKTRQAICAIRELCPDDSQRILVVCPNTLKPWWKAELLNLYPESKGSILVSTVGGRFRYFNRKLGMWIDNYRLMLVPRFKWVITHYAGVRIGLSSYAKTDWSAVIADEVHYIKNREAKRSQALHVATPRGAIRIGLTATPFSTNPADLWNQLRWMAPDRPGLQNYHRFFNTFVRYEIEENPVTGRRYKKIQGGKNLKMLSTVLSTYGVRRRKESVAPDLPPLTKTEMPLTVENRQADVYKVLEGKAVEIVIKHTGQLPDSQTISKPRDGLDLPVVENEGAVPEIRVTGLLIKNMLARLSKMSQWLSCPWKFDPGVSGVKLEWLLEWASTYNKPAVIAAAFKSTVRRLVKELDAERIDGDVPIKLRDGILSRWRSGKFQFIVGTIQALAVGLNMQYAHAMVCYDQVYSPIIMEQLMNRIHRIDLDHPVQIIHLYCEDTCNEVVLRSFQGKWKQMDLVRHFIEQITRKEFEHESEKVVPE